MTRDTSALHRLVDSGLLAEEQFAECLRTVVDKNVVASWIERQQSARSR